ncbi:hypothetical protein [Demequina muriae]|uniref:Uncharacterized protein n=1 Tax=Demequina muriae TaxID=3051664 RepID=A0ABT8GJP8_9MICO|nr:hypothetical protein [Demequina sp. EGI L300058]MDN4481649.1 hypothetical protein [Demequina sp. EGI L300058]
MSVVADVGIVVGALVAAAALGSPLVAWLLRRVEPEAETPGLLRGGMWIGVLERLAIAGAVMAGHPEAVAVVIAVKGLGRYPELRDAEPGLRGETAERFIIGTLASFVWAAACGAAGAAAVAALS